MNRMLSNCPVCAGDLEVTELSCPECDTRVHSRFATCRFCALPADQAQFLELFLRSRGNLSAVGDELGVSFPTVSKRLDQLLVCLDLADAPPPANVRPEFHERERAQILEMLDR